MKRRLAILAGTIAALFVFVSAVSYAADLHVFPNGSSVVIGGNTLEAACGITAAWQVQGTEANDSSALLARYSDDDGPPWLLFGKSLGTGPNDRKALTDGTELFRIAAHADDGTDLESDPVVLRGVMDGDASLNSTPGKLVYGTAPDGTSTAIDRGWVDSAGKWEHLGRLDTGDVVTAGRTYKDATRGFNMKRSSTPFPRAFFGELQSTVMYMTDQHLVFAYMDAGATMRYLAVRLDGADATWELSVTEPK